MSATPTSALGFQNFFQATLTSDITASSTDIPMDAIPNSTEGFLVIEPDSASAREVIFYNSKTSLKVVCPSAADGRGQDDTTAGPHSSGATVIMAPVAAFYEYLVSISVPTGSVQPYAGASEPTGWLLCYGQNISRTTYADLFTAIGTTYGSGDGSTTFTLPDLRGRVVAGQDDMGGTSANRLTDFSNSANSQSLDGDVLGATGGTETHQHRHTTMIGKDSGAVRMLDPQTSGVDYPDDSTVSGGAVASMGRATSGVSVGTANVERYLTTSTSESTVQPTIILNYIIKT